MKSTGSLACVMLYMWIHIIKQLNWTRESCLHEVRVKNRQVSGFMWHIHRPQSNCSINSRFLLIPRSASTVPQQMFANLRLERIGREGFGISEGVMYLTFSSIDVQCWLDIQFYSFTTPNCPDIVLLICWIPHVLQLPVISITQTLWRTWWPHSFLFRSQLYWSQHISFQ